ncbi:MAG: flagellar basal body-associated FliL family protein [Planctomycetota bacterium]
MKLKILIGAAVAVVLGVSAFVVAGGGEKVDQAYWDKIRGTEQYYEKSEVLTAPTPYGEKDLMVNLVDKKIVVFSFDIQYRLGGEWMETPELATLALEAKAAEIRSRIIIMFTSRKSTDFSGAGLEGLMLEIISMMNDLAFPKGMARIETMVIKNLVLQGS